MKLSKVLACVMGVVVAMTALSERAVAGIALDLEPTVFLNPNKEMNLGWKFEVNEPITVTHLGLLDDQLDGNVYDHPVGLWHADGTLLASAVISAGTGDPLIDGFRYASITDVPLSVGEEYMIAFFVGVEDDSGIDGVAVEVDNLQVDPAITLGGTFYNKRQTELTMPFAPLSGYRFGGNFQFIPEPATLWLLVFGGFAFARRRRQSSL